ncbi:MAG TPA: hypothetical protein ENN87_04110 [Phycisphaerales bacterium]|nr:hypothetical protein [Phycisphaerales bacterium]
MAAVDYLIVVVYFTVVIALGFWYQRRASRNLDAYFLGGKSIHWLALAMSGSVSNFDITGTMWIVSILFVLGFKSMWHHWMWGFLMGAFFLSYMGKWVRRSNVMTAAEWMVTRFGHGPAGGFARTTYALMAVITLTSFIGYAFQGIGKFASVYIPLERLAEATDIGWLQMLCTQYEGHVLAVAIMAATTFYVLLGGLYSVVVTDVVQTVILTAGGLIIAYLAWDRMTPEAMASLPPDWTSLAVPWRIPEFAGTEHAGFEFFGAMVIVWVLKGLLLNAGGPAQMYDFQRFLAARSARDAAKVGAAWSLFLIVRWAMAVGIALLALTHVAGVADTEKVMPTVLRDGLPVGLRGLVLAGLLAAFMSTFSSTVNSGASFIVRDIWQPLARDTGDDRRAVRIGYLATVGVVLVGLAIGVQAESISRIWNWMMMALGAAVLIPNLLRWYWWRMNGWGYAAGTLAGLAFSLIALVRPDVPTWWTFALICVTSLTACITLSLATAPVDPQVLLAFYRSVRPFGLWGPIQHEAYSTLDPTKDRCERAPLAMVNLVLGMVAIAGIYVGPMYLVGRWYAQACLCFAAAALAAAVMYFTWYRNLPCD